MTIGQMILFILVQLKIHLFDGFLKSLCCMTIYLALFQEAHSSEHSTKYFSEYIQPTQVQDGSVSHEEEKHETDYKSLTD